MWAGGCRGPSTRSGAIVLRTMWNASGAVRTAMRTSGTGARNAARSLA